ncbi:phage minor head protein [Nesterenkonia sandarakina]|uniref:Phage Mu protein F like protein n=1 Tax=Nesterenkonia sandarakina TaxID=272918 RepID=A0A2T0YIX2_9MICC|nr:phage minor head protein [Nesterenkonia sandarakina]PRZ15154.1 phage Mu protein F like protein [Nesterenkonia sandarakina]
MTDETRRIAMARRAEIVELSDAAVIAIATAWVNLWDELEPQYDQLVQDLVTQYPAGATPAQLDQAERVTQAMQTTRERLDELAEYADQRIIQDIESIVAGAPPVVLDGLRSQLPAGQASAVIRFGGVSDTALAAIVARTTSQIHTATAPLSADMEAAMKRNLTKGIIDGANPRTTARRIVRDTEGAFNGGLARASRIARTEQIDAHRAAHAATVAENTDLIAARVWMATPDARTCMSCVAMSGTEFPVDTVGPEDHPQGRCAFIDKLRPWSELGIDADEPPDIDTNLTGWFDGLTEDTQRQMLGPGRYELWQQGSIGWDDLSVRRENDDWRAAYYETPLRELSGR